MMNSAFTRLLQEAGRQQRPPVHQWNPERVVPMDFRIARDGRWYHDGMPIRRQGLVRLFASILKYADGRHWLVTPVERAPVAVDDQPFVVQRLEIAGEGRERSIMVATNVGDVCLLDGQSDLQIASGIDGDVPHIHVRDGLRARFGRSSWYHLADLVEPLTPEGDRGDDAEEDPEGQSAIWGVWSCGVHHQLH